MKAYYGLYAALMPATIYMCLGQSRQMNIGPFALVPRAPRICTHAARHFPRELGTRRSCAPPPSDTDYRRRCG